MLVAGNPPLGAGGPADASEDELTSPLEPRHRFRRVEDLRRERLARTLLRQVRECDGNEAVVAHLEAMAVDPVPDEQIAVRIFDAALETLLHRLAQLARERTAFLLERHESLGDLLHVLDDDSNRTFGHVNLRPTGYVKTQTR